MNADRRPRALTSTHLLATSSAALILVFFVLGCGRNEGIPSLKERVYLVTGKVTKADGSPLPGGVIAFIPVDPEAPQPRGNINSDGTYTLITGGFNSGAPAGEYGVRVELDPEADLSAFGTSKSKKRGLPFPAKFAKETTSGLTATVKADGQNEINFALK